MEQLKIWSDRKNDNIIATLTRIILLTIILGNVLLPLPLQAQETKKVIIKYDTALLPIQPEALEHELADSSRDAVKIYQLLRQANEQGQGEIVIHILDRLRQEEPNNAIVLSSYCLALDMATGAYKYHPNRPIHNITNVEREKFRLSMSKAREIAPDLWLTYVVEGHRLADKYPTAERGLGLLKKAVELNPETSITHYLLGDAYTISTNQHSSEKAKEELEKSLTLKPVIADARFALFQQYDLFSPEPIKAKEAAEAFVASLPPGTKVSSTTRARLIKYGVSIDWP